MTTVAGIHLPQAGRAASGAALAAAARHAEDLGFADVWASDHVVMTPAPGLSAHLLDPVVALTWAGAATSRIGLGTSVLLLPLRHPVVLAKSLASLDVVAGGRVVVGVGSGWMREEFAAVGAPFERRGALTDEAIDILRALWTEDPVSGYYPEHDVRFSAVRAKPQPERRIPIWVGGEAPRARTRATNVGDGWHALSRSLAPSAELAAAIRDVRERRPEPEFTISVRVPWDGLLDDADALAAALDRLRELGVGHVVTEPRQRTLDGWLRSADRLAEVFARVELGERVT